MCQTIKSFNELLKKEGLRSVLRRCWVYLKRIFYYPFCFLKVKEIKNLDKAIKFACFGYGGIIRPAQVVSEITHLLKILEKEKPRYILEIGTGNGGNLFLFSRIAENNAKIIGLDMRGGEFGGGYARWRIPLYKSFATGKQKIYLVDGDSHNKSTLEKVQKILGGKKLDFLFIDGDHTYDGAKKDFERYKELVKKGRIIALHDIAKSDTKDCKVDKFWKEIKEQYESLEIIEDKNQGWGGIGVIRK